MPLRSHHLHLLAAAAAVSALTCATVLLRAGPLNPPAGPVSTTYKTLAEVEPRTPIGDATTPGNAGSLYRISQPGSYYLTANLTGVSGKRGIEIAAPRVTLDLNGFTLAGAPGSLDGIANASFGLEGLAVKNGTLSAWAGDGIALATAGRGCSIHGIASLNNGGMGIRTAPAALVTSCTAQGNAVHGFLLGEGSTAEACTASGNGISGFVAGTTSFTACDAWSNGAAGFSGGGSFNGCTAALNATHGFTGGGTFTGCTARDNGGHGFIIGVGTVTGCTAGANSGDGIYALSASTIRGNTCFSNGQKGSGAGVHITAAGNRVEGNNCCGNGLGIRVELAGNLIVANSCSGSTGPVSGDAPNYVISGTQTIGPIISTTGTIRSSSPWANFSY